LIINVYSILFYFILYVSQEKILILNYIYSTINFSFMILIFVFWVASTKYFHKLFTC